MAAAHRTGKPLFLLSLKPALPKQANAASSQEERFIWRCLLHRLCKGPMLCTEKASEMYKAMRYFFHIRDCGTLISDDEGTELPDMAAARHEARATARDLAMEDLKCGQAVAERSIEIASGGQVIETLTVHGITCPH